MKTGLRGDLLLQVAGQDAAGERGEIGAAGHRDRQSSFHRAEWHVVGTLGVAPADYKRPGHRERQADVADVILDDPLELFRRIGRKFIQQHAGLLLQPGAAQLHIGCGIAPGQESRLGDGGRRWHLLGTEQVRLEDSLDGGNGGEGGNGGMLVPKGSVRGRMAGRQKCVQNTCM